MQAARAPVRLRALAGELERAEPARQRVSALAQVCMGNARIGGRGEDTHDMGSEPARTYSRVFSLWAAGLAREHLSSRCWGVDTHDVSRAFASTVSICAEIRQHDAIFDGITGDHYVSRSRS